MEDEEKNINSTEQSENYTRDWKCKLESIDYWLMNKCSFKIWGSILKGSTLLKEIAQTLISWSKFSSLFNVRLNPQHSNSGWKIIKLQVLNNNKMTIAKKIQIEKPKNWKSTSVKRGNLCQA